MGIQTKKNRIFVKKCQFETPKIHKSQHFWSKKNGSKVEILSKVAWLLLHKRKIFLIFDLAINSQLMFNSYNSSLLEGDKWKEILIVT